MCTLKSFLLVTIIFVGRGTFIESKNDIGTKVMLNLNRLLRGDVVERPIMVRAEGDSIGANSSKTWRLAIERSLSEYLRWISNFSNLLQLFTIRPAEGEDLEAP